MEVIVVPPNLGDRVDLELRKSVRDEVCDETVAVGLVVGGTVQIGGDGHTCEVAWGKLNDLWLLFEPQRECLPSRIVFLDILNQSEGLHAEPVQIRNS